VTIREALLMGRRKPRVRGTGGTIARAGGGFEFAEVREYASGDDPRRIDWAASARTGTMQTRLYLDEHALVFAAIVDESASMRVGRARRLRDAASDALDAWYAQAQHDDRALRITGDVVTVAGDGRGAHRHARASEPQRDASTIAREVRIAAHALPRASALLVISDFLEIDELDDAVLLRCGARFDATALIARDPWYDGLPLAGFVRLRDVESGAVRPYFIDRAGRARYRASVRTRESAAVERFARAGWRTGILHEADGRESLRAAFGLA